MGGMFFLLTAMALAIAGLSGYAIFGPLSYRHMQDRQTALGDSAFDVVFLRWVLLGRYRYHADPVLPKLAAPARWLLITCLLGILGVLGWLLQQF